MSFILNLISGHFSATSKPTLEQGVRFHGTRNI